MGKGRGAVPQEGGWAGTVVASPACCSMVPHLLLSLVPLTWEGGRMRRGGETGMGIGRGD